MIKAIFIAPSQRQARYWAVQWGYLNREWLYVNTEAPRALYGLLAGELPTFTCGSRGPGSELWNELEARQFTVYDGQDIE